MKKLFWITASIFFLIAAIVNYTLNNTTLSYSFIALSISLAMVGLYTSKSTK